jgi:hypothetical protein
MNRKIVSARRRIELREKAQELTKRESTIAHIVERRKFEASGKKWLNYNQMYEVLPDASVSGSLSLVSLTRESSRQQAINFPEQESSVQWGAVSLGHSIQAEFGSVWSIIKKHEWEEIRQAARHVIENNLDGIVIETKTRLMRPHDRSRHEPEQNRLHWLKEALQGVKVYILPSSLKTDRGVESKRGMVAKGNMGGAPKKISRQLRQQNRDSKILWLSRLSVGTDTVAKIVHISPQAVAKRKRHLNPNLPKLNSGQRGTLITIKH